MKILFIYIGVVGGFSGQATATELIIEGLPFEGIERFQIPHLDRVGTAPRWVRVLAFSRRLLRAYVGLLRARVSAGGAIHLSLGLTRFALVRDGLALCCATAFNSCSVRRVGALNGSLFTYWPIDSFNAKLLRWVIRKCHVVTCVGYSHLKSLQRLGIPRGKIEVVPNVCEYDGVSDANVIAKQAASGEPFELLLLSSLTDTKGYPEYLKALELMAKESGPKINAVLCGPIMMDAYRKRFDSYQEAKAWIEQKLVSINQSTRIQAKWIPGVSGQEKKALFEKAQIFILPTEYPVEAQPLVVIEAMAHGCAIVTTDVGELPSTVNAESAIILSKPTEESVKEALETLFNNDKLRLNLALTALNRFHSEFNRVHYIQRWMEILGVKESR